MTLWFRKENALEHALLKSGAAGTATVQEAELIGLRNQQLYGFKPGEIFVPWRVALGVDPDDAQPFEVRLNLSVRDLIVGLEPGFVLRVLYDRADPTQMMVDPRTIPRTAQEAQTWYTRSHLVATGVDLSGLDDVTDAATLRSLVRARQAEANNQAMATRLAARRAGTAMPATAGPPGFHADPATQLAQLDRLRTAGLIDDAHYQAKRQQLLSS